MKNQTAEASEWVKQWAPLAFKDGNSALDVACGHGRHMSWLNSLGFKVTGIDYSQTALAQAANFGNIVCADIENRPWPLPGERFDLVVVTNYLWRPLWPILLNSVHAGGLLIYETFSVGHERVGKPSNPDYLLQPAELTQQCAGWEVLGYEDRWLPSPNRRIQRICAQHP